MAFTRNGNIITVGDADTLGSFRIEPGPVKKVEVATKELLHDAVTADHYFEGQRDTGMVDNDGNAMMQTGIDADAKEIKVGEKMAYLDWRGHANGDDGSTAFYLYRLEKRTAKEIEDMEMDKNPPPVWREVGTFPSEDEAINAAIAK